MKTAFCPIFDCNENDVTDDIYSHVLVMSITI